MKSNLLIFTILVCSAFAFIQKKDIAGNWIGVAKMSEGGDLPLNFTFNTDSGRLTGLMQGTRKTYPISEGKMISDSIYFAIIVDNGSKILDAGKYYPSGDSIALKIAFMGHDVYGTIKRNMADN